VKKCVHKKLEDRCSFMQFYSNFFKFLINLLNLERKREKKEEVLTNALAMVKQASSHIRSRVLSLKLDNRLIDD